MPVPTEQLVRELAKRMTSMTAHERAALVSSLLTAADAATPEWLARFEPLLAVQNAEADDTVDGSAIPVPITIDTDRVYVDFPDLDAAAPGIFQKAGVVVHRVHAGWDIGIWNHEDTVLTFTLARDGTLTADAAPTHGRRGWRLR